MLILLSKGLKKVPYYKHEKEIEDDFNMVWDAIHKYGFDTTEDNFQIGCIGLLKASRRYDESKAKFSTFAYRCILNELLMYYRSKNNLIKSDSLDALIEKRVVEKGSTCCNAIQLNFYHEASEGEIDLKDIVFHAIEHVCSTEENKKIFYDIYEKRLNGYIMSQSEIAKLYCISATKVSRHFRKIGEEVRRMLKE